MTRRFEYRQMTAAEFSAALGALGMSHLAFARIFGINTTTVRRWLKPPAAPDAQDVARWVPVALALLSLPGAFGLARQVAAERITRDGLTGEAYPFLDGEDEDGQ